MQKYVIIGPQGSGKGTQAKMLEAELGIEHISIGDILRWNIQHHTRLGAIVRGVVAAGEMVPDELIQEVVKDRLARHDWNFGFVLDGFPRTRAQAEFFLAEYDLDAVIILEAPDALLLTRTLARRYCPACGLDYNLIHHRPATDGVCDFCKTGLIQRPDDRPEVLRARLEQYRRQTLPVIELLSRQKRVVTVDATSTPRAVHDRILGRLRQVEAVLA